MRKPLLCRLGRHTWRRELTEDRQAFEQCTRCRKIRDRWSSTILPPV